MRISILFFFVPTRLVFLFTAISLISYQAKARHGLLYGAEINYEHLSGDSMLITVNAYGKCTDFLGTYISDKDSIIINPENSQSFKAPLTYMGSTNVTPVAPGHCTGCDHSCKYPFAVIKYVWQAKVDLKDYDDCEFTIVWNLFGRDNALFYLWIEAKMNRCVAGYLNSPKFIFDQTTLYTQNQCATRLNSATAGIGDSLAYMLVQPKISDSAYFPYPATFSYTKPITYNGFPDTYTYSQNSCNGFALDAETGALKFIPKEIEISEAAIKVEQYHKDSTGKMVKVGEVTRDMRIIIFPDKSPNYKPIITSNKSKDIFICAGETLSASFFTNDLDQKDIVSIYASYDIPGATFDKTDYTRLNRGTLKWKPSLADTSKQPYRVYITAADDHDGLNGVTQTIYNIYVVKQPEVDIKITPKGCGTYTISAIKDTTEIISYKWFLNDSLVSTKKESTLQINKNGKYYIKLLAESKGCILEGRDSIIIDSWKPFNIGNDTVICAGNSIFLNASASKEFVYTWQGAHLSDIHAASPEAKPDSTAFYTVKAIDKDWSCEYFDTLKVTVSNFSISISNDTTVCANQKSLLHASSNEKVTFYWLKDDKVTDTTAELEIQPQETTNYKVIAINKYGCVRSDNVTVSVKKVKADAGADKKICFGDSLELSGRGGEKYYWTDSAGNILSSDARFYIKPKKNTSYTLIVSDSLNCNTSADTVKITVSNADFSIMPDTIICAGDKIQIRAAGGDTYMWQPENTLIGNTLPNPTVSPIQNTTYTVQISDSETGCTQQKSILVQVDKDCVWPGDANKDKYVNFKDVLYLGVGHNDTGNIRRNASEEWKPQQSENWAATLQTGTNYKHFDADGNGKIEFNDLSVIRGNYFYQHNYTPVPYIEPFSGIPLYVDLSADTFYAGDTVVAKVFLGNMTNIPGELYGAGLQYKIYCNVLNPNTSSIDFDNNFFTDAASGKISHFNIDSADGEMAIVRTNKENTTGNGEFAAIKFTLKDSGKYNYPATAENLKIQPVDVLVIDKFGNPIDVVLRGDSAVIFKKRKIFIPQPKIIPAYKIYPNPSQGKISIESSVNLNTDIYITNALGQIISKEKATEQFKKDLNLSFLRSGIYTLHFIFENKPVVERIVVTK